MPKPRRALLSPSVQAVILALLASAACAPQSQDRWPPEGVGSGAGQTHEEPASTDLPEEEGSGDPSPEAFAPELRIARMGDDWVTLGDLDLALRRRAMTEGVPAVHLAPPDPWHDPYFLVTVADAVFQERRLLTEGERLGLLPDLDQLQDAWRRHPELSALLGPRLDEVEAQLQSALGLGVADVYHVLRLALVRERWLERVLAAVGEEQLWNEFTYRRRTVTADTVALPNVPSREELADFQAVPANVARLEAIYAEHPNRFSRPESIDARIIRARVSENADEAEWDAARQRAEGLREEAVAGGDLVAMSLTRSDDSAAERGGLLEGFVERQLPEVFEQEVGVLGPLRRDRHGWTFYRIEARHPPSRRPFDELLRRELATQALASERILGSAAERSAAVLEAMRAGDETHLEAQLQGGARRQLVGPIRFEPDGHVAGVGLAPALRDALFALTEPGETVPSPFLVESAVWVARLTARHEPTRAELEAERAGFEAELADLLRASAWDAFWARQREATPLSLEVGPEYLEDK